MLDKDHEIADLGERVPANLVLTNVALKVALVVGNDGQGGPPNYHASPALSVTGRGCFNGENEQEFTVDFMIDNGAALISLLESTVHVTMDDEGAHAIFNEYSRQVDRMREAGSRPEIWEHAQTELLNQQVFETYPELSRHMKDPE